MTKRVLSVFLAVLLCASLLPATAFAANSDFVINNGVLTKYQGSGGAVTIPNSVTNIGYEAFYGCDSLTSVAIPNSVTNIGYEAFYGCDSLTSVTIPNSVTSIGEGAFWNCSSLTSVTIPNSVTSIGTMAFTGCRGLTGVTIPNSVTSIGKEAFEGCSSLTSVTIPNSVTSIGTMAFAGCRGLTSVTIPNSVTSIGEGAFNDCSSLTSVTVPNSVTSIGWGAFGDCDRLTSIQVEAGIANYVSMNGVLFNKQQTELVQYPGGLSGAYTIPNSVTSIGDYAFAGCRGLTSVTIPNSVTSIGDNAFNACHGLTSVTIPNSVTSIGDEAFEGCNSLTSVTIPSSVTSIGDAAFFGCKSLTSLAIPNSVTSIGDEAFWGCKSLTDVYYGGSEAQWNAITIGDDNVPLKNATIHYNSGTGNTTATGNESGNFSDVRSSDYYAAPVKWAVGKNITNGTGDNKFSPNDTCTTAQILTFLWRADGEPAAASANPFSDVRQSDYYYQAALWAYQNGLVNGKMFNGGSPCTRAATVTYLWKLAGSPATGNRGFSDVPSGTAYAQAVSWAVQQGITNGSGENTFSPNDTCTRGQIVTFLYRAYEK